MSLKNYKMIKEHDKHFEMQHPDGSAFKVAKSGLSKAHQDKVRKLYDGTKPEDLTADEESRDTDTGATGAWTPQIGSSSTWDDNTAAPVDTAARNGAPGFAASNFNPLSRPEDTEEKRDAGPNAVGVPNSPQYGVIQPASAPVDPAAAPDYGADAMKAVQDSVKDAQRYADQSAKAAADYQKQMVDLQTEAKTKYAALDAEQTKLKDDITNQKIDPHRIWNNASTGNKILAGIGVLLSGIGSGLTGQPNMAMQVINKTIDDDIAAQKTELGKKNNLLSENLRKYGDITAATNATAAQMHAVVEAQIQSMSAKSGSAQFAANANLGIASFQQNRAMLNQKNAHDAALKGLRDNILNNGAAPGVPQSLVEDVGLGDRAVQTPAGVRFAKTKEEAKDVGKAMTSLDTIDKRLDDMLNFSKNTGSTFPGTTNSAVGKNLRNEVIQELGSLSDQKRLTDKEVELRTDQVPDPGALMTNKAIAQIQTLKKFVKEMRQVEISNHLVNSTAINPADQNQETGKFLRTGYRP